MSPAEGRTHANRIAVVMWAAIAPESAESWAPPRVPQANPTVTKGGLTPQMIPGNHPATSAVFYPGSRRASITGTKGSRQTQNYYQSDCGQK